MVLDVMRRLCRKDARVLAGVGSGDGPSIVTWPPSASSTAQTEISLYSPQRIFTAALDTEPPRPHWPENKGQAQSLAGGTGPSPARCGRSRGKFQGQAHGRRVTPRATGQSGTEISPRRSMTVVA